MNCVNEYVTGSIGTINQNYAPAGWTIMTGNFEQVGQVQNSSSYCGVEVSGGSGTYTGADAVEILVFDSL